MPYRVVGKTVEPRLAETLFGSAQKGYENKNGNSIRTIDER